MPPSRFAWTVVFFVLTLLGILAVLMLWPANEPTHTPRFWICVTVFPAGIAAFVVLRRYSVYEGRRCDAVDWNSARKRYIEEEFERESVPVLVLGSAMRVTASEKADGVEQIVDGALTLDAQASDHEENESVSARWLQPLDARLAADDAERHVLVLEWLYDRLLAELNEPISTLAAELGLSVQLEVSGFMGEVDALALWNDRWGTHGLRAAHSFLAPEMPGPMVLDSWLDVRDGPLEKGALLLISVSLNAMLDGLPPAGAAEAGTGLLMASSSVASRHGLRPVAAIHRPVRSPNDNLDHAMTCALRWGSAGVQSLGSLWMTGLDAATGKPLHAALSHLSADTPRAGALPEFDIDRAVGNAGPTAGWLAVACAVQTASEVAAPQLVAQRCSDHTLLSVVRKHDEDLNNVVHPV